MRQTFPQYLGCLLVGILALGVAHRASAQSTSGVTVSRTANDSANADTVKAEKLLMSATLTPLSPRKAPFSVGRLSAENMPVLSTTSPLGSLAGKIAGVDVARASGAPGAGINLVLRTAFGPLTTNPPQIVIDGIWLSAMHPFTAQDLDPADVANVEVLKGPIAAALYGVRGASGVVVITTNRGLNFPLGKTQLSLRNEIGADDVADWIESPLSHPFRVNAAGQYVNAAGLVVSRANRILQTNGIMENPYIDPTYNHAGQYFRSSRFNTQTVSLQQHRTATNFNLSYARNQQPGVVPNADGYQRQTVRLNADYRVTSWARASVSASHARSSEDPSQTSFEGLATYNADANLRAADPSGAFPYISFPDGSEGRVNPLNQQLYPHRHVERDRTLLNFNVALQPFSFLTVDGAGSHDRGLQQQSTFVPRGTPNLDGERISAGFRGITNDTSESSLWQGGATAQKRFGVLQSHFSLRAEKQRHTHTFIDSAGSDLDVNNVPRTTSMQLRFIDVQTTTAIANMGLEFANKYVIDALVRRERSTFYSARKPVDVFTRVSAAWLLNEEQWLPFSHFSLLKLHAAMGTAEAHSAQVIIAFGGGGPSSYTDSFPARSTEREVGVDFIPRDRLRASVVYAWSKPRRVPYGMGVVPCVVCLPSNFIGGTDFAGHTLEATLHAQVIKDANGLKWDMALVADRRRNKLTNYNRTCFESELRRICSNTDVKAMWGQRLVRDKSELVNVPASSQAAFDVNDEGYVIPVGVGNSWRDGKSKNLWGTSVVVNGRTYGWGLPLLALKSDGQATDTKIGDANPDLQFGFQNNVRYRGFLLYTQFTGQLGGDVYNNIKQTLYNSGDHTDLDQSARPDELRKSLSYYRALANGNSTYLSNFVESGTHARLAEASVGYDFRAGNRGVLHRIGASRVQIDLVARNLFTLTGYSGLDPQSTTGNSRLETFAYPQTRTFTLATSIVF